MKSKSYTKFSLFLTIVLISAFFLNTGIVLGQGSPDQAPLLKLQNSDQAVPDEYIVVYKNTVNAFSNKNSIQAEVAAKGGKVKFIYDTVLNGYSAYLPPAALEMVLANPAVDYVEPNGVVHIDDDDVSDGEIGTETIQTGATWGLDRVDQRALPLNSKYTYTTTASSVHAYVIDTGILYTHSQFGGRATKAFDAWGGTGIDCNGHGTHVAGTIGSSTYGIAKSVKLHGVRVLDCGGSGTFDGVIAGMNWVAAHRILPAVANMSLGGSASTAVDAAVNNLISHKVTVVVSAGNDNANACLQSPARVPNAITIGSTDKYDKRSSFSNWGTCLDLFAPGTDIKSTWIGNNTATNTISGTSMASPHVAGVAALYLQTHASASPATVATAIKNSATTGKVVNPGTGSPNRLLYSLLTAVPPTTVPTPLSPSGTITDRTPTFKWTKVTNATKYQIEVYKGTTKLYTKIVGNVLQVTPTTTLAYAAHKWRVKAYVGGVWKAFSAYKTFTVAAPLVGFNSTFTSDAAGWTPQLGAWTVTSGSYKTYGISGTGVSASHTGAYVNSTYEARVKRTGCSTCANALVIRGVVNPKGTTGRWYSAYYFQYNNDGSFSVWKNVKGLTSAVKDWTTTSAIVDGGWNALKVVSSGTLLKFYINNTLVWSGYDSSLSKGLVGVHMYRDDYSTGDSFLVDWAKLAVLSTSSLEADEKVNTSDQVAVPGCMDFTSPITQSVPTDEPVVEEPTETPEPTPTDEPVVEEPTETPEPTPTDEPVVEEPTETPEPTPTDEPVIVPTDAPVIAPPEEVELPVDD